MNRARFPGQQATSNQGARPADPLLNFSLPSDSSGFDRRTRGRQGDTARRVVDDALEDVEVLRVAVQQEQAVVPHRVGDRGAGLGVGGPVRQLVVVTEGLAVAPRADPA
jgi:hypothetical protein